MVEYRDINSFTLTGDWTQVNPVREARNKQSHGVITEPSDVFFSLFSKSQLYIDKHSKYQQGLRKWSYCLC